MKYDIAFTLARTQPPHQAHFAMLASALLSLTPSGKLIHFIGSTNIPLRFGPGEKNLLNFEQRRDILMDGLQDHSRFECIPLPDFSDPRAVFTDDPQAATVSKPFAGIRSQALNDVVHRGIATFTHDTATLSDPFQRTLHDLIQSLEAKHAFHTDTSPAVMADITTFTPLYLAWAVNIVRLLQIEIDAFRARTGVARPQVVFFCCDKDKPTLKYILLLTALLQFLAKNEDATCLLSPIEMDNGQPVNGTDIRDAMISIVNDNALLQALQANPDLTLPGPLYGVLSHMPQHARQIMLDALITLKAKTEKD